MITAQYSILDSSFISAKAEQFRVSVEVSGQSLAIALYDKSVFQFTGFESWILPEKNANKIATILPNSEILKIPVSEICISTLLPDLTHIPVELFEAQVAEKYIDFAVSHSFKGKVKYEEIPEQQAVCIYRIPEEYIQYFSNTQQKITYTHFSSLFISKAVNTYGLQANTVCIFIHENSFELVAPVRDKFRVYNTYSFQTAQEFIYLLLLTLKQLRYDAETVNLYVLGGINKDSPLMETLYKYIRNVNPATFTADSAISSRLESVPKNRYDFLFQQCLNS